MRYIVVDLEATCWQERTDRARMEIIEIGAVVLRSAAGPLGEEFSKFVKPVASSKLSPFCMELTGIQQENINHAEYFWTVFPEFADWIGPEPFTLCSWGVYDLYQFQTDCRRCGLPFPDTFNYHLNLKKAFALWKNIRPCGMSKALEMMKIPLSGRHHRAIDDARNIVKLALLLLPELEKRGAVN